LQNRDDDFTFDFEELNELKLLFLVRFAIYIGNPCWRALIEFVAGYDRLSQQQQSKGSSSSSSSSNSHEQQKTQIETFIYIPIVQTMKIIPALSSINPHSIEIARRLLQAKCVEWHVTSLDKYYAIARLAGHREKTNDAPRNVIPYLRTDQFMNQVVNQRAMPCHECGVNCIAAYYYDPDNSFQRPYNASFAPIVPKTRKSKLSQCF